MMHLKTHRKLKGWRKKLAFYIIVKPQGVNYARNETDAKVRPYPKKNFKWLLIYFSLGFPW